MNKFFFVLFLIFYPFLPSAFATACEEERPAKRQKITHPSLSPSPLESILHYLPAVHLTDYFPQEGKMIAGAKILNTSTSEEEAPAFRPTLHFSLGEAVRSHSKGLYSWETKKYAIFQPLQNLWESNQLCNLNFYDTYIIGDFILSQHVYIFVPEEEFSLRSKETPSFINLIPYKGKIRQALENKIKEEGWWKSKMDENPTSVSYQKAVLEDGKENVNTADFFATLLKERPYISFGNHNYSQNGFAFLFGRIESALAELMKPYRQAKQEKLLGYESTNYLVDFIHSSFKKLDSNIDNFSPASRVTYEQHKKKVQGWLNIVQLDLDLRINHKKTLTPSFWNRTIYKEIEKLRSTYQVTREKVQHFFTQLNDLETVSSKSTQLRGEMVFLGVKDFAFYSPFHLDIEYDWSTFSISGYDRTTIKIWAIMDKLTYYCHPDSAEKFSAFFIKSLKELQHPKKLKEVLEEIYTTLQERKEDKEDKEDINLPMIERVLNNPFFLEILKMNEIIL